MCHRVSVLQIDGVDHGASTDELQGGRNNVRLGGVDHDRDRRLGGEPTHHLAHVRDSVGARVVDADVDHVGTFAHLIECHGGRRLEVSCEHRLSELL